jgi:hypothetical protein
MRIAVQMKVSGFTLSEIKEEALNEWRKFTNDSSAEMPLACEIDITPIPTAADKTQYEAVVFVRTKIDENGN